MAEKSRVIESQEFLIHAGSSEAKLVVNFLDEFNSSDFQKCLADFVEVQSRKLQFSGRKSYEMPKLAKVRKGLIKKKGLPDFEYFKKTSSEFLRRVISGVLDEMPDLLELSTKQIEICVDVIGSDVKGYYACHSEKVSGPSKIMIELSGRLLVGRIVAPKYFIGKPSYSFVEKLLLHEFRHHIELLRGVYKKEYDYYDQLKKEMLAKYKCVNVGRLALHTTLCNILSEGVAEYYMARRASRIEISMDWIRGFRGRLKELVLIQDENAALDYMNEKLEKSRGPTVYYCGKIMCYFIGLAEAKKKSSAGRVMIHSGRSLQDISRLNEVMCSCDKFSMDMLPQESFRKAVKVLNKIYYYKKFIRKYESACRDLGIEEKNMAISQDIIAGLRKESKDNFMKMLSAGMPCRATRLHLLKERIKRIFFRPVPELGKNSGLQKQP